MAGQVYFGNANYQTWIKAPTSGMQAGSTGFFSQQGLLSGRTSVRRSRASGRTFSPSWIGSLDDSQQSLQIIKDFYDGLYGDGPFYWVDPFAATQNILPPHWAAPHLCEKDWPLIANNGTVSFTSNNFGYGFPYRYATFTQSSASTRKLTIILPQENTLFFGWHSTSAGLSGKVNLTFYDRTTGATTVISPESMLAGATYRTNTNVNCADYSKVEISINASCSIVGMVAQLTPSFETNTNATGDFVSGRGTTALEFSSAPTTEYYSSAINGGQVGMSASLVEV